MVHLFCDEDGGYTTGCERGVHAVYPEPAVEAGRRRRAEASERCFQCAVTNVPARGVRERMVALADLPEHGHGS